MAWKVDQGGHRQEKETARSFQPRSLIESIKALLIISTELATKKGGRMLKNFLMLRESTRGNTTVRRGTLFPRLGFRDTGCQAEMGVRELWIKTVNRKPPTGVSGLGLAMREPQEGSQNSEGRATGCPRPSRSPFPAGSHPGKGTPGPGRGVCPPAISPTEPSAA